MSLRFKTFFLVLLVGVLLFGVSRVQISLNRDRDRLGLTRVELLKNAPPVLAFTTVALGGFRGLISNVLWIRVTKLQDEDKFFEAVQLSDWITKLEPRFASVWAHLAWNLAYNISVKFKDFPDRWNWVQQGIRLLRDEGLKYNPGEPLIYRELAWFFQHKLGANLDDANMYYKQHWAEEMTAVFGASGTDYRALINPQTTEAKTRAQQLRDKYKMDPQFVQKVDEQYGPLDWRLPEAHAIYWAALGLQKAGENLNKVDPKDLTQLRRLIYQCMQLSFYRGRLISNPRIFDFGPNLGIFPKVNAAFEEMITEEPDPGQKTGFKKAQRNVIKDAVYYYYMQNRVADAARWYRVLAEQFPDSNLLEGDMTSLPRRLTLDEYVVARWQGEVTETSRDKTKASLEGLLVNAYENLLLGEEDQATGFQLLAQKIWEFYQNKTAAAADRIGLPSLNEIRKDVLERLLDPESGLPLELANELRAKLNLTASTNSTPLTPSR
jgi:hypothetical protein